MKKVILSIALALGGSWHYAQEFDWVRTVSGLNADITIGVKSDAQGNLISAGEFDGQVDFDPGPGVVSFDAGDHTEGNTGIYLTKFNSNDDLIWAKAITGLFLSISGYTLDNQGNSYITGSFSGSVNFGDESGNLSVTPQGNSDVFVAKYNANGDFIWAKTFGNANTEDANGILVDANNNIIIYGDFRGTTDFDPGSSTYNITSSGFNENAYILTLNPDGDFIRAVHLFGVSSGRIEIRNAGMDSEGNLVFLGDFKGTVDFNPASEDASITSTETDVFITKYAQNGDFLWVQKIGSGGQEVAYALAIDQDDNIVVSGMFSGTTDLDPGGGSFTLTSVGSNTKSDIFVARYTNNGNFIWGHSFGGSNDDLSFSVSTDEIGNVYVVGSVNGTIDFDPNPNNSFNLTGQDVKDAYILKLRANGEFAWAGLIDGVSATYATDVYLDESYNVYVSGRYRSSTDFDPNDGVQNFNAAGINDDGFILKLNQCTPDLREDVINSCGAYTWIDGVTYTTNNNIATVYLENAQGCDSIVTLNLTVNNEILEATTVVSNYTIFANVPNASYQWINCANNEAIEGETEQVFVASVNGEYAVIISKNGCSDTSACVTISSLNLAEIDASELNIYPNPTTDNLNVNCGSCQISSITVFNTIGQIVLHKETSGGNTTLDIADFSKGIYHLQIETTTKTINKRITKQ